jgi:hypothetical protein
VTGAVPRDGSGAAFRLLLTLLDSTGSVAAERRLEWPMTRTDSRQ